ncbi:cell surface protein precursor [Leuconostoc kimchii IMSNU 11154]|uniref:Cell surface protein n=1 Tax=Leuconostoc kimchii (strain IMSNU 11154 / KCTC 2386 / IH25) TaxID=762051 RepID=D5T4W6_LEUKI|nr:KxYKxGKxW signal peptide domain-containing protein [Leuconostoc kimchii]ADG41118.1 cell surface protein precursor [Leuconostoc kimchii IMSNU 11154]
MEQQLKTHYKMYKNGKHWIFAGLTTITIGLSFAQSDLNKVSADTIDISQQTYRVTSATPTSEVLPVSATPTSEVLPVSTKPSSETQSKISNVKVLSNNKMLRDNDADGITHVNKDNFLEYFNVQGSSASYDESTGIVTITQNKNNQVGNFALKSKIDMGTSFTLKGQVQLGDKTSSQGGADGIGFAFHTGNTTDVGNAGGNLGIGGLQDAVGFKLDTYHNDYLIPKTNQDGAQISSIDSNGYGWDADPSRNQFPQFGAFVTTTDKQVRAQDGKYYQRWWATTDADSAKPLNSGDLNGKFHDFVVNYDGETRKLTISYTETDGKVLNWQTNVSGSNDAMAMIVSASTGGSKNLQQFKIENFDFKQAATVNVKYIDINGKQLAQGQVNYPGGPSQNGRYETTQLSIPNYKFIQMDDGSVTGTASLDANGILKDAGDNGTVVYVYAPYQIDTAEADENIKYQDTQGNTLYEDKNADTIHFVTVTDPVDQSTKTYYSKTTSTATLDDNGVPTGTDWSIWNDSDTSFDSVINPEISGYHVVSTTDPANDLAQITQQNATPTTGKLNYVVVYDQNSTPSSETPSSEVPSSETPSSEVPSSETPSSEVPSSEVPSSETPSSEVPSSEVPSSEVPSSETPSSEVPSSEVPSSETPSSEVPSSEVPSSEVPSSETPSSETPSSEVPSSEVPSSEVPSSETPSSETPSSEVPSSEVPSSETPSSEVPSSEVPSSETPSSEVPSSETPSSEVPSSETPSSEVPSSETPSSEVPSSEVPSSETPSSEVPSSETPSSEVPSSETPSSEVPSSEVPSSEVPSSETPSSEVPSSETPSLETEKNIHSVKQNKRYYDKNLPKTDAEKDNTSSAIVLAALATLGISTIIVKRRKK